MKFALDGSLGGASLSGETVDTDVHGVAQIAVRAASPAHFDLVATADDVDQPAKVHFEVQAAHFGTLGYTVSYDGRRNIGSVESALFTNVTCDSLQRSVPTPREVQGPAFDRVQHFESVATHMPVAIYVLGLDRHGVLAAEGCAEATLEGPTGNVAIRLQDDATIFGGTYQTEDTLDVTAGLDPAFEFLIDAIHGLATDPARWIVDTVAESSSTPDWLRSALSSDLIRASIANMLADAIGAVHVPGYVDDIMSFGDDVHTALSNVRLHGTLTVPEPGEFGAADGHEHISSIGFPLEGRMVDRPVSADANVHMTVGTTVTMDEHALRLPFGKVVQMIVEEVLLPRLPGSPSSIADMANHMLDCPAIAVHLSGGDPTATTLTDAVCQTGLTFIGAMLEDRITHLADYDTLHLAGTAELVDSDGDYDMDTLRDGSVQARWVGGSGEMDFTGTMVGSRQGDTFGRANPIRDAIDALF